MTQSFFCLRPCPGVNWPPLPRPEVSPLWITYQSLNRSQWLTPEELELGQLHQARALLSHCAAHVPYYRELFAHLGIVPEEVTTMEAFRRLPLLARETYQSQYARICAEALPEGVSKAGELTTSGTLGAPITVQQTNVVTLWWHAFYLRDLEWSRIDPKGILAAIRPLGTTPEKRKPYLNGVKVPYWNREVHKLLETGASHGMDIHQDVERQLGWLQGAQPTCLLSYPSNLIALAEAALDLDISLPSLTAIQGIGETLSKEQTARIQKAFRVPVHNLYTCVEAGYLASPCPEGQGLHVHAENVILEVLNEKDEPCEPGETGSVHITALHNFLNPFIRYRIGDEVRGGAHCPCGRGGLLLQEVQGKARPHLLLPSGKRRSSVELAVLFQKHEAIQQFQIVQRSPSHYLFRLIPRSAWGSADDEKVRLACAQFADAAVRVEIEHLDALPRTAGGKFRDILVEESQMDGSTGRIKNS